MAYAMSRRQYPGYINGLNHYGRNSYNDTCITCQDNLEDALDIITYQTNLVWEDLLEEVVNLCDEPACVNFIGSGYELGHMGTRGYGGISLPHRGQYNRILPSFPNNYPVQNNYISRGGRGRLGYGAIGRNRYLLTGSIGQRRGRNGGMRAFGW